MITSYLKVIDYRLTPFNKIMVPENQRDLIPECDPEMPNLSVGHVKINSMEDIEKLKSESDLFLIGISKASCQACCYSEDLLSVLKEDFD